ncbi:hypothetical protein GOV11_04010 [Candidatus Woesearchaeota archaeon]|nr:hypothetical protein [Candidatus Woesearchaeota archaeon]
MRVRPRNILIPSALAGIIAIGTYVAVEPGDIRLYNDTSAERILEYRAGVDELRGLTEELKSMDARFEEAMKESALASQEFANGMIYDHHKKKVQMRESEPHSVNNYLFGGFNGVAGNSFDELERASRLFLFELADEIVIQKYGDKELTAFLEDWNKMYEDIGLDTTSYLKPPVLLDPEVLNSIIEKEW